MLVPLIIPVYNAENFIDDLIQSIERQTCDYEAIFVDDGSSDRSGEIIQKSVNRNPRLRYIRQENSGANYARSKGVSAANGEWITFVDADDLISPNFSNICNTLCESYSGDIIATATDVFPHPSTDYQLNSKEYTRHIISQKIYTGPCAKFFRRELFTTDTFNLSREIISAEDYIMNIRLALRSTKGALITRQHFYDIRRDVNPRSAMKTFKGSPEYGQLYYRCFKASFSKKEWDTYLPEIIERNFIIWHNENRKRWNVPSEAIESECYHDISSNLSQIPFNPEILMRLNWRLRNPLLRAMLDIAIRADGLIKRHIKSRFGI